MTRSPRQPGRAGWNLFLWFLVLVMAMSTLFPAAAAADGSRLTVRWPGADGMQMGDISMSSGMIDLASLVEALGLRSSMDLMGDRLDIVGDAGACRLLVGSPLVLSKGVYTVLSGPVRSLGGGLVLPSDFLTRGLPAITGRSAALDKEKAVLTLGAEGTGRFAGYHAEDLRKFASFIQRDQYVPEEILKRKPKGLSVVVIDPGHGGRSLGAEGRTGTLEKNLVLSVSEKLKKLLEEGLGVKVVLTRTADYYVGLKERTAIANNNGADLFLSIHANATFRSDIEGFETYYLNFKPSDKDASKNAELENKALGVKGGADDKVLLEAILWDMAQTNFLKESKDLAYKVQSSLVDELKSSDRGVRQAPLAVLMGARMPAVLVEIGFLSNPEQEIRLNRESHQEAIARALYKAIENFHRELLRGEIKRDRP